MFKHLWREATRHPGTRALVKTPKRRRSGQQTHSNPYDQLTSARKGTQRKCANRNIREERHSNEKATTPYSPSSGRLGHGLQLLGRHGPWRSRTPTPAAAHNPNKHYYHTLTQDLTETVWIQSDNVHLNCNGHSITKPGERYYGVGIAVLNAKNVTITNCHISGWSTGVGTARSPNSQVVSNELFFDNISGLDIEDNSAQLGFCITEYLTTFTLAWSSARAPETFAWWGTTEGRWKHFLVLSCCLRTRPLENFDNSFIPPLPPVE